MAPPSPAMVTGARARSGPGAAPLPVRAYPRIVGPRPRRGTPPAPARARPADAPGELAPALALAVLSACCTAGAAGAVEAAHHAPGVLGDVASNDDFWDNTGRFVRYFFSVLLGTAYVALKPLWDAVKKGPVSALGTVGAIAGSLVLIYTILQTMLGSMDTALTPNYTYLGGYYTAPQ